MALDYDYVVTLGDVPSNIIDKFYSQGKIVTKQVTSPAELNPHDKIILSSHEKSALGIVSKTKKTIHLVKSSNAWGISGKNKEQNFLLHLMQDNSIRFQLVIGRAGTGKSICCYASAIQQVFEQNSYKKLVLSKPTYEVGNGPGLGSVPGDINEKMEPFLVNFRHIAAELNMDRFYQAREHIEVMPIQRMRGASFINTLVLVDETQSLDVHEMKTLCTRIGKGSKLILMGDLEQIDRKIKLQDTGLYRLAKSELIKESPLCSVVELVKNERSEISELLSRALEDATFRETS